VRRAPHPLHPPHPFYCVRTLAGRSSQQRGERSATAGLGQPAASVAVVAPSPWGHESSPVTSPSAEFCHPPVALPPWRSSKFWRNTFLYLVVNPGKLSLGGGIGRFQGVCCGPKISSLPLQTPVFEVLRGLCPTEASW